MTRLVLDECGITNEKMALLFGEIAGSISLKIFIGTDNSFGIDGLRSMIPFLQNSPYLSTLYLGTNENFNTECFELVVQTLHGLSNVKKLHFGHCNITDISAMDTYNLPNLETLSLSGNIIGREGCITLSNLLQQEGSTLNCLYLRDTDIDDQGAEIIAKSLQENTKLGVLHVSNMTGKGLGVFLKLLVDVSSIDKTYNSNHTLMALRTNSEIQSTADKVCLVNKNSNSNHAAGRAKVIENQLNSQNRKKLCQFQG